MTRETEIIKEECVRISQESEAYDKPEAFNDAINSADKEMMLKSANKYATPQYLINLDGAKARADFFMKTMKKHIPNSEIFYAFKCNDLPLLILALKEKGYNADVAGFFELKLALKIGFEKIIFTSPGKSMEEIDLSIEHNDKVTLNIDNKDELLFIKGRLKNRGIKGALRISFRINTNKNQPGTWSKYGIELEELAEYIREIKSEKKIRLAGLHFHSSWNDTPEKYIKNIDLLTGYLTKSSMTDELKSLDFLDLGGGFFPEGVANLAKYSDKGILDDLISQRCNGKYKSGFDPHKFRIIRVDPLENFSKSISDELKKTVLRVNPEIKIYFEPGRYLATHSTSILMKVVAVKENGVIVDGGINMVGDYRFEEYSFAPIINLSQPSLELKKKVIYGPLCDPSDLWGYSYFGKDIKKGDILAVLHQGAYAFSCAWRFIKPIPRYIAISGRELIAAKEEETFEDRYSGCRF